MIKKIMKGKYVTGKTKQTNKQTNKQKENIQ